MVWIRARDIHTRQLCGSQDASLHALLLKTGDLTLVEAAPHDTIWGIGRSVEEAASGSAHSRAQRTRADSRPNARVLARTQVHRGEG